MTFENRNPLNYAFGALTSSAAISDTTLTSTDFSAGLPSGLSTTTYVPMTLQDPSNKLYEIVWVTAHTASATTCTVVRGKEGTSARAWGSGTLWTVAPTLRDVVLPVSTRSALPVDPHVGMRAYIIDEQVQVEYVLNVGWLSQSGMAYRANQLLAVDAANINFTSIPSTLKKIAIAWTARSSIATTYCDMRLQINGISTSSYSNILHNQINVTTTNFNNTSTFATVGIIAGNTASANFFASGEIIIPGWDAPHPTVNLQWRSQFFHDAANSVYGQGGTLYNGAGPYVSVLLFPESGNFKAGTEMTLYGWG